VEIVEACSRGDRSIGQVAENFDLTETAVRQAFPARVSTTEEVIDADRLQRPLPTTPRMPDPALEGIPRNA
jgi:predicted ArsR family transcriptional regulator